MVDETPDVRGRARAEEFRAPSMGCGEDGRVGPLADTNETRITTSIYCPICGTQFLDIPVKDYGVLERLHCLYCDNKYVVLISHEHGTLMITAELIP